MLMGVAKEISRPEEDKNLPEIGIDSNESNNPEDFDLDSIGDRFDGDNI